MPLSTEQETTIAAAIRAATAPAVVAALAIRNDPTIAAWLNEASNQDAWITNAAGNALFENTNITKFDNLTAGKRDAWRLMLDFAPIDFARVKFRNVVADVWGPADSVAVLQACTRKATRAEKVLATIPGTGLLASPATLTYEGQVTPNEASSLR